MLFRDFDIGVREDVLPETRTQNLRYRAFVEAILAYLADRKLRAPWGKLFVQVSPASDPLWFRNAAPAIGLPAAGVSIPLADPDLLTADGEAIRSHLGDAIAATRGFVHAESGWDDEDFWMAVARAGTHRGRYSRRMLTRVDRRARLVHNIVCEWDEAGTSVYAEATDDAGTLLGRSTLDERAGYWPLQFADFYGAARQIRLTPEQVEVRNRHGTTIGKTTRPELTP